MPTVPRPVGIQIDEDIAFQRWEWFLERITWMLMAFAILGGLLGLFGGGPLSKTSAEAADQSLSMEYDRMIHHHDPATLRVTASGSSVRKNTLRLWISAAYLEATQLKKIVPDPLRVEAGEEGNTFVFHARTDGRPITVTFHLEADEVGSLPGQIRVEGKESLSFSHFVYP